MNPIPDPFDLLRLSAKPLLSKAEVEAAFRATAGVLHPDQGGETLNFQQAVEAVATLTSPSRRLLALLKRADIPVANDSTPPAPELVNLSFELETLCKEAGDMNTLPASKVERAMVFSQIHSAKRKLVAFAATLAALESHLHIRLEKLDAAWGNQPDADRGLLLGEARELSAAFAFFEKLGQRANQFSANLAVCEDNLLLPA